MRPLQVELLQFKLLSCEQEIPAPEVRQPARLWQGNGTRLRLYQYRYTQVTSHDICSGSTRGGGQVNLEEGLLVRQPARALEVAK